MSVAHLRGFQSIAYALQAASYQPVSSYLETFTTSLSNSVSAAAALSILNSASIFGQVLFGHLGDRLPYTWLMVASTFGCSLSAFVLWGFASKLATVYAFAMIFGALVRLSSSLLSSADRLMYDAGRRIPRYHLPSKIGRAHV